jgi:hypothetical protein
LRRGKFIGELKCLPYSDSKSLRGLWELNLEESAFFPNATSLNEANIRPDRLPAWLESNLIDRRRELLAAAQGAGRRVYAVEFEGRESLCDNGGYGHMGLYPKQVIAERFYSMRLLTPRS